MPRKWTHQERKKHLVEHYPEKRKRLAVMIGVLLAILIVSAALGYAIKSQYDIGFVVILSLILIALVISGIFIIDNTFYETW